MIKHRIMGRNRRNTGSRMKVLHVNDSVPRLTTRLKQLHLQSVTKGREKCIYTHRENCFVQYFLPCRLHYGQVPLCGTTTGTAMPCRVGSYHGNSFPVAFVVNGAPGTLPWANSNILKLSRREHLPLILESGPAAVVPCSGTLALSFVFTICK